MSRMKARAKDLRDYLIFRSPSTTLYVEVALVDHPSSSGGDMTIPSSPHDLFWKVDTSSHIESPIQYIQ